MQIPNSHSVKCIIFSSGLHYIMKFDYGIPVFLTIILFFQYTVGVFYDSPWHFSFPCMFVEKSDNLFCVSVLSQRKNRNNSLLAFLFVRYHNYKCIMTLWIMLKILWKVEGCRTGHKVYDYLASYVLSQIKISL